MLCFFSLRKIAGMSSGSEASQVCITHKQKTCKRKFPGPAGVLPPSFPDYVLKDTLNKTVDVLHMANNKKLKSEDEVPDVNSYLTATDDIFTSQVWRSLLIDLGPNASTVLDTFSIRASLLKACKKLLHRGKIPLMFGIIESIDMQGSDISFVIRDPSGRMKGSLHCDLIKEPETALHAGSVVILRQVSVISPSLRTHYLNVTPANVVQVYTTNKKYGVIGYSFVDTKLNFTNSAGKILSLIDFIKNSEYELNLPVKPVGEKVTAFTSSNSSLKSAFTETKYTKSEIHTPNSNAYTHSISFENTDCNLFPLDDDDTILQMCDAVYLNQSHNKAKLNTAPHTCASNAGYNDCKQASLNTMSNRITRRLDGTHLDLNTPQHIPFLTAFRVTSTEKEVNEGIDVLRKVNKPDTSTHAADTNILKQIERESGVQLKHSDQTFKSQELFPLWENGYTLTRFIRWLYQDFFLDITTDLLLSQLSEDF
uniref:Homologous recombination OB-fold protein OB-fold domain-containing protein n=1 Tax=Biomphalaria glabrata TaxID=6526 RepID=A0A2C9KND5_BIOGL